MITPKRLEQKRCLVTGGSRGLGLAICREFAKQGAKVAFTFSKDTSAADDAKAAIAKESGTEPLVFQGSVVDQKHSQEVVKTLQQTWGGLDILVNNAGIIQMLPLALIEEKDWDQVMAVNTKGVFLFSQAALRCMIRQKKGHILNIGSFISERVIESPIHYSASKSALRGLTEAMAREVGRYNIQVNLLAPGGLEGGLAKSLPQHRLQELVSQCALGRLGTLEELAKVAAFMVSDDNSFMAGSKMVVDGGV